MPIAVCPECEAGVHVDEDIDKGETVFCSECDARLEVVGLDPVELDLAASDDEDEDYGYDEDDEDY